MIIVKLQGGLGNQMFQYATAKGCLHNGEKIYFDFSFLLKHTVTTDEFTARDFELNLFPNIEIKKAPILSLKLYNGKSKLSKHLNKLRLIQQSTYLQTTHDVIDFSNRKKHIYLDGYFQSEKYFKHIRTRLLYDFRFPALDKENEQLKQHILLCKNATAIHIRRGDYITNKAAAKYHGVLPLSYYQNAFNLLSQTTNSPIDIFIFTNDILWVRENFILQNANIHFIEGNNGVNSWKDMALMSYCKNHIIANSSFSWWGAWLSERNGNIYAPYKWFSDVDTKYSIHDFIPDNWIIVYN